MARFVLFALLAIAALIVLPPLWFMAFPAPAPPHLPLGGDNTRLLNGNVVNVVEAGVGPPIVLVHGLPGTAFDWHNTTNELANRGYNAIAYSRPGYGRSRPRLSGEFTPSGNAEDLVQLIERLELERPTVVGWSYGGPTSMIAATRRPDLFGALVLVGTAGPDSADAVPPDPPAFIRFLYSDPVMAYRAMVPPLGVGLMKVLSAAAFSEGPQPDWWLPTLQANFAQQKTLDTYRAEMFALSDDADVDLSAVPVPTLLLHGDDDRLAPVAISRYLAKTIEGAKLVEYPGGSHMLPVTHASEIAKEIVAFTEQNQSAAQADTP